MKKSIKKSILAAAIVAIMLVSLMPTAFANLGQREGTITGGGSVLGSDVVQVMIPVNLNFALNPYGFNADEQIEGSMVARGDYPFMNKTADVPVLVVLNFTLNLNDSEITLETDPEDVPTDDFLDTTKALTFGIAGASDSGDMDAGVAVIYDIEDDIVMLFEDEDENGNPAGTIALALDGAAESVGTSSTIFSFYGTLNPFADWQPGDLSISGAYRIQPIPLTLYTDLNTSSTGTDEITAEMVDAWTAYTSAFTTWKALWDAWAISEPPNTGEYTFDGWEVIGDGTGVNDDNVTEPTFDEQDDFRAWFNQFPSTAPVAGEDYEVDVAANIVGEALWKNPGTTSGGSGGNKVPPIGFTGPAPTFAQNTWIELPFNFGTFTVTNVSRGGTTLVANAASGNTYRIVGDKIEVMYRTSTSWGVLTITLNDGQGPYTLPLT